MTRIRAEEDILMPKPGQLGAYTILYHKGDLIREEDAEMLGVQQKSKPAPPEDKAQRGPREAPKQARGKAARDKALSGPKEE